MKKYSEKLIKPLMRQSFVNILKIFHQIFRYIFVRSILKCKNLACFSRTLSIKLTIFLFYVFNNMNISIIIPMYNSENTIKECLCSIVKSKYKEYEIIVVDDNSNDRSAEIVKKHNVIYLKMEKNIGALACRNLGAKIAKGEILLFIDSDIKIKEDTLQRIKENFNVKLDISAINGTLDPTVNVGYLCTQYKSIYVNYVHNKIKTIANNAKFIYSAITAIRTKDFVKSGGFDETKRECEDDDFGYKFSQEGYKIVLDTSLTVYHLKKYQLTKMLISDFKRCVTYVVLVLNREKNSNFFEINKYKNYSHFNLPFIFGSIFALTTFFLFIIDRSFIFLVSVILYFWFTKDFIKYMYLMKRSSFILKCFPILFLDQIMFGFGIILGFTNYLIKKKFK